jgi:putative membrane protein
MAARAFHEPAARERVSRAVAEIEKSSSAEVVVALRPSSGHYRHTDYLVGALVAFVALLVFCFHPMPMRVDVFAVEAPLLFVLGALTSAFTAPLRRALTSRKLIAENVARAARATFVELGVSQTRRRSGVLVYISLFERNVRVLPDIGVDPEALGQDWATAVGALESTLAGDPDVERFVVALGALGEVLARALPVEPDDVNELPDEVRVA